jgi:hypothetical protein
MWYNSAARDHLVLAILPICPLLFVRVRGIGEG